MKRTLMALMLAPVMLAPTQAAAAGGCGFENGEAKQGFIATCEEEKQEVILTGELGPTELSQQPGYDNSVEAYQPKAELVAKLAKLDTPTELVVIIGTWCPDCHRETPRLGKVLAEANNPMLTVRYIGVDRSKQDPEGLAAQYDFQRIPTMMVIRDGEELGRITERPEVSIEADLVKILGL